MVHDSPAQADTVLIVDLSNLVFRAHYANSNLTTSKGEPSGHVFGAINCIQALLRDLGSFVCPIYCMDGHGAKEERQKILPEYKANREKRDFNPIPGVKEVFQYLPGLHIEKEGREGDDAIAYACRLCASKNVIVHSGDRDLLALMTNPNVKVYSPNKARFIEPSDIYEVYHVLNPGKIYLAKALFGDSSDYIKGVDRLQKKQVEPVLNDPKCVDIDSFYGMLSEKPVSMTEKMWLKTKEAESRVRANYKVILPNLEGFTKNYVKRVFKIQQNYDKLVELLKRYECFSVLSKVGAIYE